MREKKKTKMEEKKKQREGNVDKNGYYN